MSGVQIHLTYKGTDDCCPQIRWIQTVSTNDPRKGRTSPFIDGGDIDDGLPFYETYTEYLSGPNIFYDFPVRSGGQKRQIDWQAELCVYCVEWNGRTIRKKIQCISYGFSISPGGRVRGRPPKAM
jgi:hypothetical protein